MKHVEVQDERIPALGLGTWQLTGEECVKSVREALDTGYRHIDTAQAYDNEAEVGQAIQESNVSRDDIWLTTKIWRSNFQPDRVISSFHESLEKLQTEYVDLLLIHWPHESVPVEDTLEAMASLVDDGKVKNIGVSNFTTPLLQKAIQESEKPLLTDQVEYHPFLNQDALLEKCRENDIMLTAYSPLARGEVVENETLGEIGERYSKTAAQVALRWLIQQENVAAIPKASSRDHLEQNFEIFDFKLSKDEMNRIHEMTSRNNRRIDPGFAPAWD